MYLDKYVIDYETLFCKYDAIEELKNAVLFIPISSVETFLEAISSVNEKNDYTEEEKEDFFDDYKRFLLFISNKQNSINSISDFDNKKTEQFIFDTESNLYMCFYGSFENDELQVDSETSIMDYDVLNAALCENAKILTINEDIIEIIKDNNLKITTLEIE